MKASMFKYKTQLYEINHLLETAHIQKAMEDGTYKPEPGLKFGIKERGHARYITSAATADKAVNHITCDEYLTPLLQKYLQYDNSSSQVGKGVAFHRHRFEIQLRNTMSGRAPMKVTSDSRTSPATTTTLCMKSHWPSSASILRGKSKTRKNWRMLWTNCGWHSALLNWMFHVSQMRKSRKCTMKRCVQRSMLAFHHPP